MRRSAFFWAGDAPRVQPRSPEAFPVPTISRRPRARAPSPRTPVTLYPSGLDHQASWRDRVEQSAGDFTGALQPEGLITGRAVPTALNNRSALGRPNQAARAASAFFPEAEAERLALNPRLPHHRRPLTLDEALAGILIIVVCGAALLYAMTTLV